MAMEYVDNWFKLLMIWRQLERPDQVVVWVEMYRITLEISLRAAQINLLRMSGAFAQG
jgi:hypothetical protein